jgi:hypothetical protein
MLNDVPYLNQPPKHQWTDDSEIPKQLQIIPWLTTKGQQVQTVRSLLN